MGLSESRIPDLLDDSAVPYFFWDRNITTGELRAALSGPACPRRVSLLRALLREARPDDVWSFVTPQQIADEWESVAPGLGRHREFWEWLLGAWRDHGFLR